MRTSESIKNIALAMAKFQAEVKNPANTADNPFYHSKYAPLNDVLNLVRPLLTKQGLSVLQSPSGDGERISVTTLILHESGEWIESDSLTLKADKATAQGAGSAITYARRYALSAMLGISSEDDDDGNYASGTNSSKGKNNGKKDQETEQNTTSNQNIKMATDKQKTYYRKLGHEKGLSDNDLKLIIEKTIGRFDNLTVDDMSKCIEIVRNMEA